MNISVTKTNLDSILFLRGLYLNEINAQVRYNACHERGWSDSYIIRYGDLTMGYGSVKGNENLADRDAVFEFYIIPSFRHLAGDAFRELLKTSGAAFIECQTNDKTLCLLIDQFAEKITAPVILFEYGTATNHAPDHVIFRARHADDIIFEHGFEPIGNYVLELNNEIVATGGFLLHYNFPYADIFMEVMEPQRKRGLGSFLVQELIKQCYLSGRVPAARTSVDNIGSQTCLLKAGLRIAGHMLLGSVNLPQR